MHAVKNRTLVDYVKKTLNQQTKKKPLVPTIEMISIDQIEKDSDSSPDMIHKTKIINVKVGQFDSKKDSHPNSSRPMSAQIPKPNASIAGRKFGMLQSMYKKANGHTQSVDSFQGTVSNLKLSQKANNLSQ